MPRLTGRRARALTVATVRGVPVDVGMSWPFLTAMLMLVHVDGRDLRALDGWFGLLGDGLLWTVLLAVSVVVHELGHLAAARAFGLAPQRLHIDVWGGHTTYLATPVTPFRTTVIAVAGPLANLLLAGCAYALSGVPLLALTWLPLMTLNLGLALYHLLPGLPLDCGQVIVAVTWWLTRSRTTGLEAGAWAGRFVMIVTVSLFLLVPIVLVGRLARPFDVLWVSVVGYVMWRGTTRILRSCEVRKVTDQISVREATRPTAVVAPDLSLGVLGESYPQGSAVIVAGADGRPRSWARVSSGRLPDFERDITDVSAVMANPPPPGWVTRAGLEDGISDVVEHMRQVRTEVLAIEVTPGSYGLMWSGEVNRLFNERAERET